MPGNGTTTEQRNVGEFESVALGGVGNMTVRQGDRCSLSVTADTDVLPRITSEVKDGTLILGIRMKGWLDGLRRKKLSIRYEVTMRDVKGLTLSGAGRIDAPEVTTGSLALVVSGAGAMEIGSLTADALEVTLSGAGSCEVSGKVRTQSIRLSGVGSYNAPELESETANAVVSGAGDVMIHVSDTLDAKVSGTGSIRYHGAPTVRQRVTGVGCVTCTCTE